MTPLQRINAMPHGPERARAAQAYIREEREKMMTACEHLHAAVEQLPEGWLKKLLEWAFEHAGCGDTVTPLSGGGGPTNPPEPPK